MAQCPIWLAGDSGRLKFGVDSAAMPLALVRALRLATVCCAGNGPDLTGRLQICHVSSIWYSDRSCKLDTEQHGH